MKIKDISIKKQINIICKRKEEKGAAGETSSFGLPPD